MKKLLILSMATMFLFSSIAFCAEQNQKRTGATNQKRVRTTTGQIKDDCPGCPDCDGDQTRTKKGGS